MSAFEQRNAGAGEDREPQMAGGLWVPAGALAIDWILMGGRMLVALVRLLAVLGLAESLRGKPTPTSCSRRWATPPRWLPGRPTGCSARGAWGARRGAC